MSIDWDATGSMLQGWGSVGSVGAIMYAAWKGNQTYESWKAQRVAERKLDQAERILTAAYRAKDSLSHVRNPIIWAYELSAAEVKLKGDLDQWNLQPEPRQKRLVTAQALFNRLERTSTEKLDLYACLPMARAHFGRELENSISTLLHQFRIVEVDIESYIDDTEQDADFTAKILIGMGRRKARNGQADEVSEAISGSIEHIESVCLPALKLERTP